jgi:hypothetical protein
VNLDENNANNPNPSRTNYPKKHGNLSNCKDIPPEWEIGCLKCSPITEKGGRIPPMHGQGGFPTKKGPKRQGKKWVFSLQMMVFLLKLD